MVTTAELGGRAAAVYVGTKEFLGRTYHAWLTDTTNRSTYDGPIYLLSSNTPEECWASAVAAGSLSTSTQPAPDYFDNCNLDAWKIWYCLDNDASRFAWADSTNGKGVIYRMIDEWNNDCPYDFKNILIAKAAINSGSSTVMYTDYTLDYYYTFNKSKTEQADGSMLNQAISNIVSNVNIIGAYIPYNIFVSTVFYNSIFGVANVLDTSMNVTIAGGHTSASNCISNSTNVAIESDNSNNRIINSNIVTIKCRSNDNSISGTENCYLGSNCSNNVVMVSNDICINDNCSHLAVGYSDWNTSVGCPCTHVVFEGNNSYIGIGAFEGRVTFKNYRFKLGTQGTESSKINISSSDGTSADYEKTVAKRSDGTVVTYCEADLITNN